MKKIICTCTDPLKPAFQSLC